MKTFKQVKLCVINIEIDTLTTLAIQINVIILK